LGSFEKGNGVNWFVSEEHEEFRIKLNNLLAGYKFLLLKNRGFPNEKHKKTPPPRRQEGFKVKKP
jgi:hypothetical protein